MRRVWMVVGLVLGVTLGLPAQEREDRTLLTQGQMNAIINEASGERALHHVMELVPYQFVRPPSEYQGHFRESDALARMAREYGFSNVAIEDFPTGQTWQPLVGELWITAPDTLKLYDIHDIPESLASSNATGDITGDLTDVDQGTAKDFEGKDVKGKFVLSLAPSGLAGVYARAVAARRNRGSRHQRDRCRRSRGRLPDGGGVDYRFGAARHGGLGALAAHRARARDPAQSGTDGDHTVADPERAGPQQAGNRPCRDSRRRQHARRRLPSAGISSRATSSREPTTTTRAAP